MRNIYLSRILILVGVSLVAGITLMLAAPQWSASHGGNTTLGTLLKKARIGLTGNNNNPLGAPSSKVQRFSSFEQLAQFMKLNSSSSGSDAMYSKSMPTAVGQGTAPSAGPAIDFPRDFANFSTAESAPSPDYSHTNIQVQGVDEADLVKTDGKYIYTLSGNSVFIVEAYPAEGATITSQIDLKQMPQDLYINGDFLVVYGQDNQIYQTGAVSKMAIRPSSGFTFFKVYDVSDHKNPKLVRDLSVEGYYLNSRKIGNFVYLVTVKRSYDDPVPLPRIMQGGTFLPSSPADSGFVMPSVYYFDIPYASTNLTTVTAINVADAAQTISNESYVLDDSQQMYVSPNNIYITYTKYLNQQEVEVDVMKTLLLPRLTNDQQKMVRDIEASPNYILSQYEKTNKVMAILGQYAASLSSDEQQSLQKQAETAMKTRYEELRNELEKTIIHKIAIKDGTIAYQSAGEVPGYVLNQYAMDESDGYFRIATTRSQNWLPYGQESTKSYSNVFVLDSKMNRVGGLENLEPGEQIFAVRFMQERAYLVTYHQIDPLFVIDMKDPAHPTILGQLKMPGYSSYLHPYDDTTLIGLGRETYEDSPGHVVNKGMKVAVFDVSDVSSPKETAHFEFGSPSTDSPALQDPHAFLFSKEKNLLVIPVTDYNYGIMTDVGVMNEKMIMPTEPVLFRGGQNNAAYVFSIAKDSIKLRGTIEHSKANENKPVDYNIYWRATIQRSLYINEILYTISQLLLKANKLDSLAEVKSVVFPQPAIPDQPVPIPYGGSGGGVVMPTAPME